MFFKDIHVRIRLFFVVVIILFLVVIGKVIYIQVFEYDKLSNLSSELWSRNLPIEGSRGLIYDRNGVVLADNVTTTSLVLIPNQITDKKKVIKELASILNVTEEEMEKHVNKKTSIERVHPEGRRLSFEVADKIAALNLDGVYLVKESKRNYPYDTNLSHVLGYVGIDNQGLSGLELQYDKYLTGEYGSIKYYSDAKGNKLKLSEIYEQPQDGMNITLTINNDIQLAIERELDNAVSKYNPEHALAIAMDPNTGEILGMSSRPNFSPSNYQNYSTEEINRNLPIWMNYEPGSTFKIITLASSLEENTVDLQNDHFYDGGSVRVANAKIKCWKTKGHGAQTFLQVVENSCNPGFVALGQRLGKERLFSYIEKFGFGKKTGIDLNGEATGIIFKLDRVGEVELATTAFGQGISVTALQQVTAVSAIVNGGTLYTPYIVSSVGDDSKSPVIKKENIITKETSDVVKYALESVVANGSGRNAYIENYRIGGKTGTAQKVGSDGRYMQGNYVLSFIGFMPADNPDYVMYIAIDHAKGVTQYGGVVSAPIARNVFKDIISIHDIKEDTKGIPKSYRWDDIVYKMIPDVIGKTKKEAKKLLQGFNVEFTGDGDNVIDTSPNVNSRVKEGSTIKVLLN